MAAFYFAGERKRRPGVYIRLKNIGSDNIKIKTPTPGEIEPGETTLTVDYDEATNALTINGSGILVSHDGNYTVALIIPGVTVSHDGAETVTIGG